MTIDTRKLVAEIEEEVRRKRATGELPADLERELDNAFARYERDAVLLSALFCAAAGASSNSPRITEARAPFPDRAYVLSLPSTMRLDPSTVQVLEDGRPVSDLTVLPSGGRARQFGIVLVIDASNSMRGKPIAADAATCRRAATGTSPTSSR